MMLGNHKAFFSQPTLLYSAAYHYHYRYNTVITGITNVVLSCPPAKVLVLYSQCETPTGKVNFFNIKGVFQPLKVLRGRYKPPPPLPAKHSSYCAPLGFAPGSWISLWEVFLPCPYRFSWGTDGHCPPPPSVYRYTTSSYRI